MNESIMSGGRIFCKNECFIQSITFLASFFIVLYTATYIKTIKMTEVVAAAAAAIASPPSATIASAGTVENRWDDINFDTMARLWKFDAADQAKMRELQRLLHDIDHWKNDPFEVARYLKDFHKFPVSKIAAMFRKMVEWRLANQIDTFCEAYGTPNEIFQYFPCYVLKDLDHDGDPIIMTRLGVLDAWGMYQEVGADAVLDYFIFFQEMVTTRYNHGVPPRWNWQPHYYEKLVGNNNKRVIQFTSILDVEGLSRRHLRPVIFGILNRIARIGQDYYAGVAKRIIILRAPRIFQIGWNVCKHFLDPHIIDLITITTSSDYLELCDQYMDRTAFPACMYPEEGQGQAMPGYFETVRLEGGRIPDTIGTKRHAGANPPSPVRDMNDTMDSVEDDADDNRRPHAQASMKRQSPVEAVSVRSRFTGSFSPSTHHINLS
jgi:CRAL/TRIO domain